jgi:hypothetical protein
MTVPDTRESFEQLFQLLLASTKSELRKRSRAIVITKAALADLVLGSMGGLTPWNHRRHHREFVPSHLVLTEDDKAAFVANGVGPAVGGARKFINKISAIFDERRLLSGHLFFTSDFSNWHLLYFDQRDTALNGNHWEGGSHIHLINHLWPKWTAQTIWEEFCTGNPQMKGTLHLRFVDEYRQPLSAQRSG